ncbi:MAG: insulinase family protein [Chitinophagaceae bacterium]|nr:MAG: insulinase family protein [Chitinophagaceae bacterium]
MISTKFYKYILSIFLFLSISVLFVSCTEDEKEMKYPYKTVEGDPLNSRIYTLDNGLKVYLSNNPQEPRIQTFVAVRAGSKHDPAETTGLAHYLEHMLFKGTDKMGTINWEKEKVLLDKLSDLYEEHRFTDDEAEKRKIYAKIDSISFEASKLAIPNEYDKMISSIGARGTNAYTSVEQTVYVNDIPANELERWLKVEAERFRKVVLRLFHTELETVYEEFNMGQANDGRKAWRAMTEALFPTHQYGTQTTIGEGEHLKNPSMVNIHKYFEKYYIPNNMAICLSGELDYDETIRLIDKYFGGYEMGEEPVFTYDELPPIEEPVIKEVVGNEEPFVYAAFRFDGAASDDALMIKLISGLLSNGQAGLIDLNLLQRQRILGGGSFEVTMEDYSIHGLYGSPRQGQTLEDVKALLLDELEKIKAGEFEEWLIEAVINNFRLQQIRAYESNRARASAFVNAFVRSVPWENVVTEFDRMEKITKQDIVDFANKHYSNNYAVIYKRSGVDEDVLEVEKPQITPIVMNRDTQSVFYTSFTEMPTTELDPVFIDYDEVISREQVANRFPFYYIENEINELFSLNYIYDMGKDHDRYLELAVNYLPYLGTTRYSADELKEQFFRLGLRFDVSSSRDNINIRLSGLESSLEEGIELFEHILTSATADEQALNDLIDGILKERVNQKLNKNVILRSGMVNYAMFGANSPFTYILSEEELKAVEAQYLVDKIRELADYPYRIFYYGQENKDRVKELVENYRPQVEDLREAPEPTIFKELPTEKNEVYFIHYNMVQTDVMFVSRDKLFDKNLLPYAQLYLEFFGAGLSSIVFQEIREAKALAYSAWSVFSMPARSDNHHFLRAYVGTQADKLEEAVEAMIDLMNNLPDARSQFEGSRESAIRKIQTERITGQSIFWDYEAAKKRGLDFDVRELTYNELQKMDFEKFGAFFDEYISDRNYKFLVLGDRNNVDFDVLARLGEVKKIDLDELFGY